MSTIKRIQKSNIVDKISFITQVLKNCYVVRIKISNADTKFVRRAEIPNVDPEYYKTILSKIPRSWRSKINSIRTDAYRTIWRYSIGYSEILKGYLIPKDKIMDLLADLQEKKEEYYKVIRELENNIPEINKELKRRIEEIEGKEATRNDLLPESIIDFFIFDIEIEEHDIPEPIDIVTLNKLKEKKLREIEQEVESKKRELLEQAIKEVEEKARKHQEEYVKKILEDLYKSYKEDFEDLLDTLRKIIEQVKKRGKPHKNTIEAAKSKINKIREKNNYTKLPDVEPLLSYAEEQLKILSGEEQPIIVTTQEISVETPHEQELSEFVAPIINPLPISQTDNNPLSEIRDELSSLAKLTLSVVSSLRGEK